MKRHEGHKCILLSERSQSEKVTYYTYETVKRPVVASVWRVEKRGLVWQSTKDF